MYSPDRSQLSASLDSGGYSELPSTFFPLGKTILTASHTKDFEAVHAKSRAEVNLNFQVQNGFEGLEDGSATSLIAQM